MERLSITVGAWIATPALNLLERDGRSVKLEPRAMEMLVYLARNAGKVISLDELIKDLWNGRASDDALVYKRITQLRKALGDKPRAPQYIETIPKRGYRLIAPVEWSSAAEPAAVETPAADPDDRAPASPSAPAVSRPSQRWRIPALITAATFVVVAALSAGLRSFQTADFEPAERRSVAVLPFTSLSADTEENDFLTDGMHDVLLAHLAKINNLTVISRASVMPFRNSGKAPAEIGRELGVAAVLEGTVQRLNDVIRVNVQLIDTQTEEYLWAELYDRRLSAQNLFAIQSEMATAVAGALRAVMSPAETQQLGLAATQSTRAYEFYLLGEDYMRRVPNAHWTPLATRMYEQAVAEDPDFALAWSALARAHIVTYDSIAQKPSDELLEKAGHALSRAAALAPDMPELHLVLARLYQGTDDYARALEEFEIAEQRLPGGSYLYRSRANVHRKMGNYALAVADMERAIDLDPLNIEQLEGHVTSLVLLRDYARAAATLDRILEIRPDLGSAFIDREVWLPLVRDGDVESARAALADPRLAEVDPAERYYLGWLTALYARHYDQALECLDHWHERTGSTATEQAQIAVLRGVTHWLSGEHAVAKTEFAQARPVIEDALRDDPDDPRLLILQAQALAGLGEDRAAVEAVRRGVARLAERSELTALTGPADGVVAATVYVMIGDDDAAAAQLEAYLAGPGEWSLAALAADPRFESLTDRPSFR